MAQVESVTGRVISAPPDDVFDALADYRGVRARVLPPQFSEYEVREGGDGQGSLVHWRLQATSRRVRDCLIEATEPEEDNVLVERDRNSSMETTWRVLPGGQEGTAEVRVRTVWQGAKGVGGFFERRFAPRGLARIHDALLARLAAELEARPVGDGR